MNPVVTELQTRAGRKHCISWITKHTATHQLLQQARDRMRRIAIYSRPLPEFVGQE